jgi:dephospho-CoA kinase
MMLLLAGASGGGKSHVLRILRSSLPETVVQDADELEIPTDKAGRQSLLEQCVAEAVRLQENGASFILGSQSPLGELLACPSAGKLESVGCCLIDCHEHIRIRRLLERGDRCGTWIC